MSSQPFNKKSPTIKRILREATELATAPSADYHAAPLEENLFEWHFTLRGPPSTPYSEGIYHGRITLPPKYPLRPPSFRFLTPSGRFEVNREICLSISGHHEDTWQPAWGIRTAVVALRGFMESEAAGQVGGVECDEETRRGIAGGAAAWRCEGCGGRSNEEILSESKVAAEAAGTIGERGVEVRGVKIGYRDEMGKGSSSESEAASTVGAPEQQSSASTPTPTTASASSAPAPPIAPAHLNPPHPPYLRPEYAPRPDPPEVQTPWLDKLIMALIAVLIAHVIKKLAAHM